MPGIQEADDSSSIFDRTVRIESCITLLGYPFVFLNTLVRKAISLSRNSLIEQIVNARQIRPFNVPIFHTLGAKASQFM